MIAATLVSHTRHLSNCVGATVNMQLQPLQTACGAISVRTLPLSTTLAPGHPRAIKTELSLQ